MSLAEFIYTEILKPKPLKALVNRVLLRIVPECLQVGPAKLYLDPGDPVVSGALTLAVFEPSELVFFQKYFCGTGTFVDIGANIGLYTVLGMHQLDGNSRIVAFEPHPGTFQFLERNIAVNRDEPGTCPHVDALNLAAAPERATLHLRLNPENRGDNRLYQGTYQGRIEQWETLSIQAVPVDEALAELGIREVNFVKIDIQGYEEKAIRGFQQTLARSENILLMSEFWPKGLREAGGSAETYLAMLCDLGFRLYELKEKPRGALQPLGDWQTFIQRLPGRKYTNIVGVKGAASCCQTDERHEFRAKTRIAGCFFVEFVSFMAERRSSTF